MINLNKVLLKQFEEYLESIPLERYRNELMTTKTVEQDLPKNLNPIPSVYDNYWISVSKSFLSFEDFFNLWWKSHLEPLDEFIRKYFWGCSQEFVRLGFKARVYRTYISVLTQFQFSYTWNAHCPKTTLSASAEDDMKGLDATVHYQNKRVGIQIKKETYRREAGGRGRFISDVMNDGLLIEIPYTITKAVELQKRVERARKEHTRKEKQLWWLLADRLLHFLPNGFVIFEKEYPQLIEKLIVEDQKDRTGLIEWKETIELVARIADKTY